MTAYKHILIAADLVERDDHPVIEKALDLAKATGAKLSIIHVLEYPQYYGVPDAGPVCIGFQIDMEKAARTNLDKLASKLNIPPARRHIPNGQAKTRILETAEKNKVDLIIIGSHGRHGIGLFLMGSTATGVIHGAKCDVLAVRVKEAAPKRKNKKNS